MMTPKELKMTMENRMVKNGTTMTRTMTTSNTTRSQKRASHPRRRKSDGGLNMPSANNLSGLFEIGCRRNLSYTAIKEASQ
jgi:hypothetical protein